MTERVSELVYNQFNPVNITSRNISNIINETISYYWPKNLSKPNICYFDNKVGPVKSKFVNNYLGIEEKVEKTLVENSMIDDSCVTPMNIKPYKNNLLISYSFKVKNKKERGSYSMCSVISEAKKEEFDLISAEKEVSCFAFELEKIFEEYFMNGGAMA